MGRNLINISAVGTGTGKFNDPWISFEQNFSDIRAISFLPDLSAEAAKHFPTVFNTGGACSSAGTDPWGSQYDRSCNDGTNVIDIARYNPFVGYKIQATVKEDGLTEYFYATVQMDHKDVLRQEYINHKESIKTLSLKNAKAIPIPARDKMILTSSLPAGFVENKGEWSDYKYEYAIEDGMVNAWVHVNQQFDKYLTENTTLVGLNDATVTLPTNTSLEIGSGFRNPERQERVGSVTCSKHMLGKAVDISPIPTAKSTDLEKADKALKYYTLWKSVKDDPPAGDIFYQLERSNQTAIVTSTGSMPSEDTNPRDGVPDTLWEAGHLHFNIGEAGACP